MGILLGLLIFVLAVGVSVLLFGVYKANQMKNKVEGAVVDGIKQVIVENAPKVAKSVSEKVNKKINPMVFLILFSSFTSFSQIVVVKPHADSTIVSDTVVNDFVPYIGGGISLSSGSDFYVNSYASIEFGMNKSNFGMAMVIGRGNLSGINSTDNIRNYYYEGKVMGYMPMGKVISSVMFGYGGYFDTPHMFIEYGMGISYTRGKISYGVLYSNWDGIDYITPNISYNF